MKRIPSYKALLALYNAKPEEIKYHFQHLPKLVSDELPYDIAIAYSFLKIEQAQNRALYGGVVKIHRGNAELAKRVINIQHLTRDGFKALYTNIFGGHLQDVIVKKLNEAEKTRDKVIHGKTVTDNELREAIADVLDYAEAFNSAVDETAGFKPFGDMRGFKGRADSLDIRTTKWLMKGLGFGVKA